LKKQSISDRIASLKSGLLTAEQRKSLESEIDIAKKLVEGQKMHAIAAIYN
jgi:hypothetical protein